MNRLPTLGAGGWAALAATGAVLLAACASTATPRARGAGEAGLQRPPPTPQPAPELLTQGEPLGEVAPEEEDAEGPPPTLPRECSEEGDLCTPPPPFVDRLCRAAHVGTALRLFEKSSPFTRAYVRVVEVPPINLRGGPASDLALTYGEEVLLLAHHGGESGELQISGLGGYDVLRWDGTCANVSADEVAMRPSAEPRYAPFPWRYIEDDIRDVLLQDERIKTARARERKQCRGAPSGDRAATCRVAAEQLRRRVVLAVRGGLDLPEPEYVP